MKRWFRLGGLFEPIGLDVRLYIGVFGLEAFFECLFELGLGLIGLGEKGLKVDGKGVVSKIKSI